MCQPFIAKIVNRCLIYGSCGPLVLDRTNRIPFFVKSQRKLARQCRNLVQLLKSFVEPFPGSSYVIVVFKVSLDFCVEKILVRRDYRLDDISDLKESFEESFFEISVTRKNSLSVQRFIRSTRKKLNKTFSLLALEPFILLFQDPFPFLARLSPH